MAHRRRISEREVLERGPLGVCGIHMGHFWLDCSSWDAAVGDKPDFNESWFGIYLAAFLDGQFGVYQNYSEVMTAYHSHVFSLHYSLSSLTASQKMACPGSRQSLLLCRKAELNLSRMKLE